MKYVNITVDEEFWHTLMPILEKHNNIVLCKDCKYWDYEVNNDVGFCVRTEDCDWNADDFCSKGEKR